MFSSSAIAGTAYQRGRSHLVAAADPRARRDHLRMFAFTWPGVTWITIAILFGAYALVDGIFAIVAAVRAASTT